MAGIKLQNVPKPILSIIDAEQKRIKEEKEVKVYSREMTVYSIIKAYAKSREQQ